MRVPIVGPQIDPTALRIPAVNLDAGPESFGAGIARGLGNVGETAFAIDQDKRRQADAAAVVDLVGTATNAANSVLSDPENGILNRQMKDAIGATADAGKQLARVWKDAATAATSDNQKAVIRETATRQITAALETVRRHEADQTAKYHDWSAGQMIKANLELAASMPLDDATADDAIAHSRAAVDLRMKGRVDEAQLAQLRDQATSEIQAARLDALDAGGDTAGFLKLFDRVRDQLSATPGSNGERSPRDRFSRVAMQTFDLVKEQSLTDSYLKRFPNSTDMGAALDAVHADLSGPEEEHVAQAAKVRYQERESAANASGRELTDRGWAYVETGKFAAMPPSLRTALDDANPHALIEMSNEVERRSRQDAGPSETDPQAWGDFMYTSPPDLAKPDNDPRIKYAGKFTANDMQRAIDYRAAILNEQRGLTRTGAEIQRHGPTLDRQGIESAVSDAWKAAGLYKKDPDKSRYGAFSIYVHNAIDEFQDAQTPPRRPDAKELQAIMDRGLIKGERVRPWYQFNQDIRAFEARPEDTFVPEKGATQAPAPAAVDAERARIESALRSVGIANPTDADVEEYRQRAAAVVPIPFADRLQAMDALKRRGIPATEENIRTLYRRVHP
jgi:hypothetical protein